MALPIPEDAPVIKTICSAAMIGVDFTQQKTASYLHRTATTTYPCCVPALGDSAGAGRVGLAAGKDRTFSSCGNWDILLISCKMKKPLLLLFAPLFLLLTQCKDDPNFDDLPKDTFSNAGGELPPANIITRPSKMNDDEDIPF